MPTRAALYIRVSTDEQDQANQLPDLEQMATRRGLQVVSTYSETVSGAARARPELERMMRDAAAHRFDIVLVWALDRLGRRMGETVRRVLELEHAGVDVLSAREPWLDTSGPVRPLLVSVFAWVAEQERTRLVERTNAGLARARAKGIQLGRPSKSLNPYAIAIEMEKGGGLDRVARRLGVGRSTLFRELKRFRGLGGLPKVPKMVRKKGTFKRRKRAGSTASP